MTLEKLKLSGTGFDSGQEHFDKEKPVLVMIHGAGGDTSVWRNQTYPLKKDINTLALDLPGHGTTRGRGVFSIGDYSQWLGNLLKTHFREAVFLMGHSMGGAIAQKTALEYPDCLRGIILVDTGPRMKVAPAFLEGLKSSFKETVDSLIQFAYGPGTDSGIIKQGADLMKRQGRDVVIGNFEACNRFDMSEDVKEIHTPCLILCGEEDKLTPPSLSRKLNESMRGSTLKIIPSAGHMLMIENPKAFNRAVLDFISSAQYT